MANTYSPPILLLSNLYNDPFLKVLDHLLDLRLAVPAVMPSAGLELRAILSILLYFIPRGVSASTEGYSPRRKGVIAPRDIVAGESRVEFGVGGFLFVLLEALTQPVG